MKTLLISQATTTTVEISHELMKKLIVQVKYLSNTSRINTLRPNDLQLG